MRRHPVRLAALALVAALVAACGAADDGAGTPTDGDAEVTDGAEDPSTDEPESAEDPDTDEPEEADPTGEGAPVEDPEDTDEPALQAPDDLAVEDAARTFGVDEEDIEVVLSELVTWNDGSLGCPRPGEMYTQALVDGYRIILLVDGTEHAYHGAEGQEPFRCEDPADPHGTVDS